MTQHLITYQPEFDSLDTTSQEIITPNPHKPSEHYFELQICSGAKSYWKVPIRQ